MKGNIYESVAEADFESSPMDRSGSKYEDMTTISYISSAELSLFSRFQTWHSEILENFYLLSGHIYSAADLRKIRLEKRPDFEWNFFMPIIQSIVGNFKSSIPSIDFIGETPEEEQGAKLQKTLNDYFLFQANDIEYELAKAFLTAIVGRIGWLKTSYSYLNDPSGMINIEWYDSLRLKFDTNWRRRDTSDMRFISDSGWYEASEIIDIYAKNNPELREEIYDKAEAIVGVSALKKGKMKRMMSTWAERWSGSSNYLDYQGSKHGYNSYNEPQTNYNNGEAWYNGAGRFKTVDWFEKRQQPIMEISDLITGEKEDITDFIKDDRRDIFNDKNWFDQAKLSAIRQKYLQPVVQQSWKEKIYQISVVPALNLKLYDAPTKVQNGYFKFTPILCHDFHPDILETKSIIDVITDPVKDINYRKNTILTYLMKMGLGQVMAEEGAIKDKDAFASNEIGAIKSVENGALQGNRIKPIDLPQMPQGLLEEINTAKEDLQIISSQSPNAQGRSETKKETGTLFQQRVMQSNLQQEWLNDNAQYSLYIVAKYSMDLARIYMKMPRTIAIVGDENDPQWIKLNQNVLGKIYNDVSFGRYNIKLSKQPYGKKANEAEYQKIMEVNAWLGQLDPAYIDPSIALKMSGLTVKNEMINHIKQVQQIKMQQAQADEQAKQQQAQKDDEDRKMQTQLAMNHEKIDLLNGLNGLHAQTLDNKAKSDEIATNAIMNSLFTNRNN